MMRKLASIQTVTKTEPIPGADAIERLHVLGWWVVGKKGEFRPGEKVVYCEIDSLLPERPEFEFLRKSCFKPAVLDGETTLTRAGFRIKTVKLRGQVSQGICFPLSILPDDVSVEVGDDVTGLLEIVKYEPPIPMGMGGRIKGGFPAFLPKTDEVRIQVLEPVLERCRGEAFYLTEKLDGTSFTAFLREGEFGLCSRNLWLDETDESNVLVRLALGLELPRKLGEARDRFGFDLALQGEAIGPGIQGNKYARPRLELWVFNVIDIGTYGLVDRGKTSEILEFLGLQAVPSLGSLELGHTVDELVELSVGPSLLQPKIHREGIVFRPAVERQDPDVGGRLSFKAINPQFLLKFDE